MLKPRATFPITFAIALIGILVIFAGRFLVLDGPQPSDCIVVLEGDAGDVRLQHGLQLLRDGYGKDLLIDAPSSVKYGRPMYEYAEEYASKQPPATRAHVHICAVEGNSTQLELRAIGSCIKAVSPSAASGLIVTSTFHSRRALSVAKHVLPQYRWSVGAAPDPTFGVRWWQRREWAKNCFMEWQKTIWWQLFERWSDH